MTEGVRFSWKTTNVPEILEGRVTVPLGAARIEIPFHLYYGDIAAMRFAILEAKKQLKGQRQ